MRSLVLMLGLAFAVTCNAQDAYEAITTKDPGVPVEHLDLLLTPLRLEELQVEAEAWLDLVQAKAREISKVEIAAARKRREISAAEDAAESVREAREALAAAEGEAETDAAEKLEQAAGAVDAAKQEEEAMGADDGAAEQAAEAAAIAAEKRAINTEESVSASVSLETEADATALGQAEEAVTHAVEAKTGVREELLEKLNTLRDERTALIKRANLVVAELAKKGGEVESYKTYLTAVAGIHVDLTDRSAVWSTVTGWVRSPEGGVRWAFNAAKFLATVIGFWVVALILGGIVHSALGRVKNMTTLMREFGSSMLRRSIILVGFIVGLSAMEIDIGPLLAMIGAAGFVIAFALQDTLSNFASGIMILVYRPFDVGHVVDVAGVSGKVNALNLVSVTIKTFDNKTVVVPNNSVWNDVITNATGSRERRVDLEFGIGYGDDMKQASAVLERVVKAHPLVLDEPAPTIRVNELGDSSVNFVCRPWVKTPDYWDVYWDLTQQVKEAFDAEGISIPFPQRDVHLYGQGRDAEETG